MHKKAYVRDAESNLEFVNSVKENLETVRPEPLTVATLLCEKTVVKAEDIDREIENVKLHSFK